MKKLVWLFTLILLVAVAACSCADGDSSATVTIINRDRTNVRDASGNSFGRLLCYTPVTPLETKGDMTYVSFPKALFEIWKDAFTLSEYGDTYTGTAAGWVKTECLSEVTEDVATLTYQAEQCRWELWVEGIYHQLHGYGLTKNKNFDTHEFPTVNGWELSAHTSYNDLLIVFGLATATPAPQSYSVSAPTASDVYHTVEAVNAPDQPGQWSIQRYAAGYLIQYEEIWHGSKYTINGYFSYLPADLNALRWWVR